MKTYDTVLSFKNDFYKELYKDGMMHRNQINNKFTPTVTILTAEIGGILWMISKLGINKEWIQNIIAAHRYEQIIIPAIGVLSIGAAIYFFIRCFTNYEFEFPEPEKTKKLIEDNKKFLGQVSEDKIVDNIIYYISESYREIASNDCTEVYRFILCTNLFTVTYDGTLCQEDAYDINSFLRINSEHCVELNFDVSFNKNGGIELKNFR